MNIINPKINHATDPKKADIWKYYQEMAHWYWRANDKPKTIASQQKAMEILKDKKDFLASDLAEYESRLQEYEERGTVQ